MFNMGTLDRSLRAIVALVAFVLIAVGVVSGTAALVIGIVACVLALTSLIGICPAYLPFNFSTRRKRVA
jgi:hypothetical protein